MSKVLSSIENPFIGRTDGLVFEGQKFVGPDENDIVEYYEKEKIIKIGEGEDDYKKELVVVEFDRRNRRDYINSFRNDVGILNILRKCALSGEDAADGRYAAPAVYNDISEMPESLDDAFAAIDKGRKAFSELDPDLKGKAQNIEQFVDTVTDAKIQKYIEEQVAKKLAEEKAKESEGE